ncbi:MAG: hypothetical protein ACRYF0_04090 [Janthinobacterium lividum]
MNRVFLLGCLLSLSAGCEQQAAPRQATAPPAPHPATKPAKPVAIPEGAVQGDFDGDGTAEYVWLVLPARDSTDYDCVGACISYLTSSNPSWKPYALEPAVGGELTTFSHLGAGRRDYVGIAPALLMGCWNSYYVLTYRAGGWQLGVKPFSTHCDQWEKDTVAIARDPAHAGHVLVHYTDMAAGDFAVKIKSVPLR